MSVQDITDSDRLDVERFMEIYDSLMSRPATDKLVVISTPSGRSSWVYEQFMEGK